MHISPEDMAKSGCLMYDLDGEIKPRYLFLERAGLYRHPNPKSIGLTARAEPNVGDVLNTDLEEFLAFACDGKLTAEEYNTFLGVLLDERDRPEEFHTLMDDGIEDEDLEDVLEEQRKFKGGFSKIPRKKK